VWMVCVSPSLWGIEEKGQSQADNWWLTLYGNLKRKNRDHKKVSKQDEDTGNLKILLHFKIPILTAAI